MIYDNISWFKTCVEKKWKEFTHLLLALPFHIERSQKINNQYIIADEAGNGQ